MKRQSQTLYLCSPEGAICICVIILFILNLFSYCMYCYFTFAYVDKVDAFDIICLRRILRIPYMDHVANGTVRFRAGSPPQLS